jgi:hypothetical protein
VDYGSGYGLGIDTGPRGTGNPLAQDRSFCRGLGKSLKSKLMCPSQVQSRIKDYPAQRNGGKDVMRCNSVPGHHVFNNLQAIKTAVSFQFQARRTSLME